MSGWLRVVLLLLCSATVLCTVTYGRRRRCYSQTLERYFKNGDEWDEPGCLHKRCIQGRVLRERVLCPPAAPPAPGCYYTDGDPTGQGTDCCPKIVCENCWAPALSRYVASGETWTEPACSRATCSGNVVSQLPCGLLHIPPGCRLRMGDQGAQYPQCCPTMDCSQAKPCFVEQLGQRFAVGERWTLSGCTGLATCREGGIVSAVGCPLTAVSPGAPCALDDGEPDSLDYPSCCPKITCPACHSERLQRYFGPGDVWTERWCVQSRCELQPNYAVEVLQLPCHLAPPPHPSCQPADGNLEEDFPHCCPTYSCSTHCFSRALDRWFAVGEEWTGEGCTLSKCVATEVGPAVVVQLPCGLLAPPPDSSCQPTDGNSEDDYPHCCPTYSCPTHCFSRPLGRWFAVGEEWTEEGCTRSQCLDTDGSAAVVQLPCGLVGLDRSRPDCYFVDGDDGADYPGCCLRVKCGPRPVNLCYSSSQNHYYQQGDRWTEPPCTLVTCGQNGSISGLGCGLMGLAPGSLCVIVPGRPGTQQPHCCPQVECPDETRACYDKSLGRWLAAGETWTGPGCTQKTCHQDGTVGANGCPLKRLSPGSSCRLTDPVLDGAADFPECCPQVVCPLADPYR